MTTASPTTVIASFTLLPDGEPVWEAAYKEIIRVGKVRSGTGLYWAHLLRDLNDDAHLVISDK